MSGEKMPEFRIKIITDATYGDKFYVQEQMKNWLGSPTWYTINESETDHRKRHPYNFGTLERAKAYIDHRLSAANPTYIEYP